MDKKTKGCLLIGCGVSLFFVVVIGVILIVMGFSTYRTLKIMTSETPVKVEVYNPTEEEKTEAADKINNLLDAMRNNKKTTQEFTSNDINTLISTDPRLKEFKGKIKVDIADNKLILKGSIPLKFIPGFRNRYINGDVSVKLLSDANNKIKVCVEDIKINGQSPPRGLTAQLRQKNLIQNLYNNPQYTKLLRRIKEITIKNNKLVVELTNPE